MTLFFAEQISFPSTELSEEEAHHGVRVLRLREGEKVWITDGNGEIFEGTFHAISGRHARVELAENPVRIARRDFSVTMAVAPLKSNDRFEWFLEKATELGAAEIVPLICKRSERMKFNKDRWERIVLAAVKQSLNPLKPLIHEPLRFSEFVRSNTRKTFLAHCAPGHKALLSEALGDEKQVCICIGPEGDFSDAEIQLGLQAGYVPVSLGALRLRTETAAIAALVTAVNRRPPGK